MEYFKKKGGGRGVEESVELTWRSRPSLPFLSAAVEKEKKEQHSNNFFCVFQLYVYKYKSGGNFGVARRKYKYPGPFL